MLKRAITAMMIVGMLTGAALAVSAPALADVDPCGTNVSIDPWTTSPNGTKARKWYWFYHNCGAGSVRRVVDIEGGDDSPCYTITGRGYSPTITKVEVLYTNGKVVNHYVTTKTC
ncbi:hypothetical protein ACFO1B_51515 [Dactylosporangium siamense]|uniref:Uncharacterized protein n=1 Tax=Dactylosporangium siamense TaxID=685454 RepID=A0A919U5W3_9ACTN|nr:hypothetical protein [Dactylosporangium siamense]GIG43749.1 hypothetical protein Dsi01nite_017900 [Dactylosporangium siamense]